jgi:hypothetical protein
MPHIDPDVLALLALGEDVAGDSEHAHLATCRACRAQVDELAGTAAIGRTVLGLDRLVPPPPRVWDAVAAELELPADLAPVAVLDPPRSTAGRSHVVRPRPRRRRLALALAALVVVLAAVVTVAAAVVRAQEPHVIAQAALVHLPGWSGAAGHVDIEQYPDGRKVVVVTTNLQPRASRSHEVWLMDAASGARVEVGFLRGESGRFPLPQHVDLRTYSYIDISAEPHDGNPAPSGQSIVRGPLRS